MTIVQEASDLSSNGSLIEGEDAQSGAPLFMPQKSQPMSPLKISPVKKKDSVPNGVVNAEMIAKELNELILNGDSGGASNKSLTVKSITGKNPNDSSFKLPSVPNPAICVTRMESNLTLVSTVSTRTPPSLTLPSVSNANKLDNPRNSAKNTSPLPLKSPILPPLLVPNIFVQPLMERWMPHKV